MSINRGNRDMSKEQEEKSMSHIDIISIVFLFVIVGIGFVRKCNIGVLAIGSALVLGKMGGG